MAEGRLTRDRDASGRPRNARPRDVTGRPLARGAAGVPEPGARPFVAEAGAVLGAAARLVDAGRPFAAHELFEQMWKAAPVDRRDLWRGLAQIAVGLTHAQRGNVTGAVALLGRGAELVAGCRDAPTELRIEVLLGDVRDLVAELVATGSWGVRVRFL
ncbi:MAG TPA: DUF309 domain-containing protein [Mycobacteriales bacterium]|nr:DUF309 domain-containing protein [Mycobacteriales bacterium]